MQYIPTAIQHHVEYCTERMTIKYCYIQKKTAELLSKRNGMNDEYLVKAGMSRSMDISASLSKTSKNPKPVINNNKKTSKILNQSLKQQKLVASQCSGWDFPQN